VIHPFVHCRGDPRALCGFDAAAGWLLRERTFHGVLEKLQRLAQRFAGAFVSEVTALQVEIVRFQISVRGLDAHQRALQRRRDRACDLVLHREDAFQLAVVGVRPQMIAVAGVDQLRGEADAQLSAACRAYLAAAENARQAQRLFGQTVDAHTLTSVLARARTATESGELGLILTGALMNEVAGMHRRNDHPRKHRRR